MKIFQDYLIESDKIYLTWKTPQGEIINIKGKTKEELEKRLKYLEDIMKIKPVSNTVTSRHYTAEAKVIRKALGKN